MRKALHADFEQFFQKPSRSRLKRLLEENRGEFNHLDFKGVWPKLPKLARHLLAFANSGGGVMVVGVHQDESGMLDPRGIASFVDKADVANGIHNFIPANLEYEILDLSFEFTDEPSAEERQFQVILVEDHATRIPFVSVADGDGVRKAAIYVRSGTGLPDFFGPSAT